MQADVDSHRFLCPLCHHSFDVEAREHGRPRQCPQCDGRVVVLLDLPVESSAPATSASAPATRARVASRGDVQDPSESLPGPFPIPTAVYVVAALFLAGGAADVVDATTKLITLNQLDIWSFGIGAIKIGISWGLMKFRERWRRGWAQQLLVLGIILRVAALIFMGYFFYSKLGDPTNATWSIGSEGQRRPMETSDGLMIVAWALVSMAVRIWQFRTLRRDDVRRVFHPLNRDNLVGQMSMVRFFLLVTLLLSIYLATGRMLHEGWGD